MGIHRDLKPENIMLDVRGYIKLIDFGTAKQLGQEYAKTYTVVGTPYYMAPEIIRKTGYSLIADFWSLGVILFEMVCGHFPFGRGEDDPRKIKKSVRQCELKFPARYACQSGRALLQGLL